MRKIIVRLFIIILIAIASTDVFAANHYIRQGASGSGNGSDWTNACTDFSGSCTTLVRGDTYYVADGTYACRDWTTANSGTTIITIKKASDAGDHGTATGWVSTYGDGQAIFSTSGANCMEFTTDYWNFDGQYGGGPGAWRTNLGFKIVASIDNQAGTTELILINNQFGTTRTNINLSHVEGSRTNFNGGNICDSGTCPAIVYSIGLRNSTWSYLYFHDTDSFAAMRGVTWDTVTIQYSLFESINRKEVLACSQTCNNLTLRYNYLKDVAGTGHLVATVAGDTDPVTNWFIYGNIFSNTSSVWFLNDCIVCTNIGHGQSSSNVLVYNNTLVNMYGMGTGTFVMESCTGCDAKNNLYYTTTGYGYTYGGFTSDYDWCYPSAQCTGISSEAHDQVGAGNPFTNLAGENFSLTANTTAGSALSAPYNTDMFGTVRSTWTRGALEFAAGDLTPPNAPTGLYISRR